MPSYTSIAPDKLARLVGTPRAPTVIDVREPEAFGLDRRHLPTAMRRTHTDVQSWAGLYAGKSVAVVCQRGEKSSEGVAAWLRHHGARAEVVDGGFEAWRDAGLPLVPDAAIPARNAAGSTIWVTRSRPKIDRIACPWLIRRFVDPDSVFLFVAPAEVAAVADQFDATPFDVEGVHWSHRDELCTFDMMVSEFGLSSGPLDRLATIVRAADTDRLDLAPEAAGLLAVSLGLSRMHGDDLEQLDAGMAIYDAMFRWARDATGETHNWPSNKARS